VREDVLGIADTMHAAMKNRGSAGVFDLGTITAFIDLLGMLPGPAKPILNKVGDALGPLATLLGIQDSPSKPPVEFAGDMPDDVVRSTKAALKKLAETIKGRERVIDRQIRGAMRTVTSRGGSFDLPTPQVLAEKQIDGMAVNLDRRRQRPQAHQRREGLARIGSVTRCRANVCSCTAASSRRLRRRSAPVEHTFGREPGSL
jgi:hypothetical protein